MLAILRDETKRVKPDSLVLEHRVLHPAPFQAGHKFVLHLVVELEICGSNPGYDTNFSLKNYHLSDIHNFQY